MIIEKELISTVFQKYFFGDKDSAGLKQSVSEIPEEPLTSLARQIKKMPKQSRIFFMGNGGSLDNARYCAILFMENGFLASVPAFETGYSSIAVREGYENIYEKGLELSHISEGDIVIGLSGSGNSANINKALQYAQEKGAKTFCFGGRDGFK